MIAQSKIRNFCIIAHIDHGKSTLADRFIQKAEILTEREFTHNQMLDSMEIEQERGITIKSQVVSLPFTSTITNETYYFNLVDTPGHVDFTYEVSRAISSCEGALLLVDASQGVEAQTLANFYLAFEHDLVIIPVINKIDLPAADINRIKQQIEFELGLDKNDIVCISAKQGIGITELLEQIVLQIPPPQGDSFASAQGLIFDAHYDPYRGVVVHFRIFSGHFKNGDEIMLFSNQACYTIEEIGLFRITLEPQKDGLYAGEVGYFIAGIKTISDIHIGDTVTLTHNPCLTALAGFKNVQAVVFSSIYPVDSNDYSELIKAIEKLKLNDASLIYEKDSSAALGIGLKCGFLGMLHLEVVQERLEREFNLSIVFTAPSVQYQITLKSDKEITIETPDEYPDPTHIKENREPFIRAHIITPSTYMGNIITLCLEKRGIQTSMNFIDEKRIELYYEMPLAEILFDFYDTLKSISKGYASFDYEIIEYRPTNLVRLDILVNGHKVDAMSQLVFKDNAQARARGICKKLREEIPRQQFKIPIQGAIGGTIIARETISALRKDVTAKCYGGDISRKRKLLEKQKAGKKRMKMVGNVELPQSAFLSVMRTKDN